MITQLVRAAIWNDETRRARAIWRFLIPGLAIILINAIVSASLSEYISARPIIHLVTVAVTTGAAVVIIQLSGRILDAGRSIVDYGLAVDRTWYRDLVAGFGIGLAGASIPFLVGIATGWFEIAAVFDRGDLPVGIGIAVLVLASLFTGIWEELLARGVVLTNAAEGLQSWLSSRQAIAGGVVISALLFGLPHLAQPDNPLFILTWILSGLVLGVLYVLSGNLALVIGIHWSFNIVYQSVFVQTDVNPEAFSAITRIDLATQSSLFEFGGVLEAGAWVIVLVLGIVWLLYSRDALSGSFPLLGVEAES